MKRIYVAWTAASVSALTVFLHIAFTAFFRFVVTFIMRLSDWMICRSSLTALMFSAKVVFIKKRPQNRQFKGAGNYCTSCDRSLQETYSHCSLGCKVDFVLKHYKELTPFLKKCNTLTLSPDFMIPHEIGDDIDQMTNETPSPHSSIVDCDESDHQAMRWSSWSSSAGSSSGSENMTTTTHIVRKKRSGCEFYLCARSANKVSDRHHHHHIDMATSIITTRRKGIPHRSPLC
ncbi:PLATZ transcription factor family protein [Citrus sinensis]|nr:PLATZ transcription factor family protein [Citrus sinensis]